MLRTKGFPHCTE